MRKANYILLLCALAVGAPRASGSEAFYADNVVIVLDGSGSMRDLMRGTNTTKMATAKSVLHDVLAALPETTHVGVLVFSDTIEQDWIYPLGPKDDASLRGAIDAIQPGGGTPLGKYLKIGADRLLEAREAQYGYGTYRLLVVTDGKAGDETHVRKYTPEIIARGITMDVIGVMMRGDHMLATQVHSYRRADDAAALQNALAEVMAEVTSSSNAADDLAADEAFELIEALPMETAQAIITSLATSGNNPIGVTVPAQPAQPAPRSSSPAPSGSPVVPRGPGSGSSDSGMCGGCCGLLPFVILLGGILFVFARRAKR